MSKRSSNKSKRRSKALPALGFAGVSLSMAGGACASTSEASANTPPTSQSQNELFLGEEEVFDTSLSTFYTFDKENGEQASLAQHLKLAAHGGCGGGGCGGHGGCGGGGCGGHGGCGGGGGCGGHGGCGGGCAGGIHVGCGGGGFHGGCRCGGRFFRGCGGCGCGGCGWGCGGGWGVCWVWTPLGWINTCWGESTPAAKVASVASEPVAQIAEAEEKR
jgi:hypothetical protein